jgi:hypothetical protein
MAFTSYACKNVSAVLSPVKIVVAVVYVNSANAPNVDKRVLVALSYYEHG